MRLTRSVTARLHLPARLAALVACATAALVLVPLASAATVTSSGPLTAVEVTTDLNCAVNHTGDSAGEFYGNTACGTLLASGGTLYGPASIPAGGGASPRTTYTPVSQTAVTGSGTNADPYTIVTVVDAGTSGLRVTEKDTYVVGQESYRTDVTVANTGSTSQSAVLYRGGDCYLQDSDYGFGAVGATTGAVSCVSSTGRIEQWYPLSAGSKYFETTYSTLWARMGSQQEFPDTCDCATNEDNAAGLSWALTIAAGASVTRSHLTTFSPLGIEPLSTTKTADSSSASAGGSDGYTITIHNPNPGDASIDSITDTLPSGFAYASGSTTGATTANPTVSGQNLSWSGPFTVPGGGDVSLHFGVTVASTAGTYYNNAGGTSTDYTVAPTGDTAPVTVNGSEPPPPPPPSHRGADLSITKTGAETFNLGWHAVWTITVTNNGPDLAYHVNVTDTMPAGLANPGGTPSQGGCSADGGVVTCDLGMLHSGASATVTVFGLTTEPGEIVNTATVSSPVNDPDPGNNSASASATVVGGE